ncbi:MAG: hypothetical protein RR585_09055, partial [Coprobacillus sp.]
NYDDKDFTVLLEHIKELRGHTLFNKNYGIMISTEKVIDMNFDEYDYFFTKVDKEYASNGLLIKPAGKYIRAFCKGDWDKLPMVYRNILSFANEHGLSLKGYAYEEGLNEMMINNMEEYITQILIRCE